MVNASTYDQLLIGRGTISRRGFVKGIGVAVAGAALLILEGQLLVNRGLPELPAQALVRATFAPYVGESFHAQLADSDVVAIQLFKVRDLLSARMLAAKGQTIDSEQNFSIVFRGPVDRPLIQDVYRFEHTRFGGFELFIVPMQADQGARYYEAIFNRLGDHTSPPGTRPIDG